MKPNIKRNVKSSDVNNRFKPIHDLSTDEIASLLESPIFNRDSETYKFYESCAEDYIRSLGSAALQSDDIKIVYKLAGQVIGVRFITFVGNLLTQEYKRRTASITQPVVKEEK